MKIILDTNVFVSGVFFKGPPYQILKAWQNGKIQLVLSPEILDEYYRVSEILAEEHPSILMKPVLDFVIRHAEIYTVPPLEEPVCEDPDDDKFLACALASDTAIVVSGDKLLLKVSGYRNITVLKPRDFTDQYLR